jgi:hypothetical protein
MEAGGEEVEKVKGNGKKRIYPMCGEEKLPQTLLRSAAEYAHGDETAGTKYRVA